MERLTKKASIFIFLLLSISGKLFSQHCPWDGTGIMIFEIKANKKDTLSINNLKLTLTDSLGNKVFGDWYSSRGKEEYQIEPFQNQHQAACDGIPRLELRKFKCYYFAKNHYVIVAGMGDLTKECLFLIIEDVDGKDNGGLFLGDKYKIDPKMAFSLCTNYSNWNEGSISGFNGFQTENVILKRMED